MYNEDSTLTKFDSMIEKSISTFIDNNLNKQKELLSKYLHQEIKNKLTQESNDKELFTPNYGKSFFNDFINYLLILNKAKNTKSSSFYNNGYPYLNVPKTINILRNISSQYSHYLSEDEYIIGLYGIWYKPRNSNINSDYILHRMKLITNKMNIISVISNIFCSKFMDNKKYLVKKEENNILLSNLQIDLIMKLFNNFNNEEKTILKLNKQLQTINENINCFYIETNKLICNLVNIKTGNYMTCNLPKYENCGTLGSCSTCKCALCRESCNCRRCCDWKMVHSELKNWTSNTNQNPHAIKLRKQLIDLYDQKAWISHNYRNSSCYYGPFIRMIRTGIILVSNKSEVNKKFNRYMESLYDDILQHLIFMFKTYWNGKNLSSYAKALKLENDKLKKEIANYKKINAKNKL